MISDARKQAKPATKAVIMARGLGTRMRRGGDDVALSAEQEAMARSGLKALIPVAGRPFLDYVISGLADAGYEHVCIIVAPDDEQLRRRYTSVALPRRVTMSFAVQQAPHGTADAVLSAQGFVGDDLFLVINSDNYYPTDVMHALRRLGGPGLPGFDPQGLVGHGNIDRDRIARFALLETNADGHLARIIEKPDERTIRAMGAHAPVSMNSWMFGPKIFEACQNIKPSARGELELADAVQYAIAHGERFVVIPVSVPVIDMTRQGDIENVARDMSGIDVRL